MSAAKHTPGPWQWPHDSNELCPVNPDHRRSAVSQILYAEGGYGFLGRSNSDTLAELEADRRLIAAAPELLEALQQLLYAVEAQCVTLDHRAAACTAIAKATGSAA